MIIWLNWQNCERSEEFCFYPIVWLEIIKNDQKWSKMIHNDSKWFKTIQNDSKWFIMIWNDSQQTPAYIRIFVPKITGHFWTFEMFVIKMAHCCCQCVESSIANFYDWNEWCTQSRNFFSLLFIQWKLNVVSFSNSLVLKFKKMI